MFKPSQQNLTQFGDELFPDVIQAPLKMRVRVEGFPTDGGADLQQLADDMTSNYSSDIQHFVNRNRHQRALGGIQQQRTRLELPGLSAMYTCNQGHEFLDMVVRPTTGGPSAAPSEAQPQSNLDGYVAWLHHWYQFPGPNPLPSQSTYPIDLILNGYSLLSNYTPSAPYVSWSASGRPQNEAAILYVALFGETALQCESLQSLNPVLTAAGLKGPRKVLPKRPQLQGGPLPNAGSTYATHDDVFGYFVLNMMDPRNSNFFGFGSVWVPPPITYVNGLQFKSAKKSPLNSSGLNQLDFQYRTHGQSLGNAIDYLFAEFYDRKSKRGVAKIWSPQSPDYGLTANDKPKYWTRMQALTSDQICRLTFDLTPGSTAPDDITVLEDQPVGPFDAVDTFGGGEVGQDSSSFKQRVVTIASNGSTWSFPPWG